MTQKALDGFLLDLACTLIVIVPGGSWFWNILNESANNKLPVSFPDMADQDLFPDGSPVPSKDGPTSTPEPMPSAPVGMSSFPMGSPAGPTATSATAKCYWKDMWHQLNTMRQSCQLCDVQLFSSDNQPFMAHSPVLAASSPVFHDYFVQKSPAPGLQSLGPGQIQLGLPANVVSVTLDFIYGHFPTSAADLQCLKLGADTLLIHGAVGLLEHSLERAAAGPARCPIMLLRGLTDQQPGEADLLARWSRSNCPMRDSVIRNPGQFGMFAPNSPVMSPAPPADRSLWRPAQDSVGKPNQTIQSQNPGDLKQAPLPDYSQPAQTAMATRDVLAQTRPQNDGVPAMQEHHRTLVSPTTPTTSSQPQRPRCPYGYASSSELSTATDPGNLLPGEARGDSQTSKCPYGFTLSDVKLIENADHLMKLQKTNLEALVDNGGGSSLPLASPEPFVDVVSLEDTSLHPTQVSPTFVTSGPPAQPDTCPITGAKSQSRCEATSKCPYLSQTSGGHLSPTSGGHLSQSSGRHLSQTSEGHLSQSSGSRCPFNLGSPPIPAGPISPAFKPDTQQQGCTVPADGLALSGASTSAGTMMPHLPPVPTSPNISAFKPDSQYQGCTNNTISTDGLTPSCSSPSAGTVLPPVPITSPLQICTDPFPTMPPMHASSSALTPPSNSPSPLLPTNTSPGKCPFGYTDSQPSPLASVPPLGPNNGSGLLIEASLTDLYSIKEQLAETNQTPAPKFTTLMPMKRTSPLMKEPPMKKRLKTADDICDPSKQSGCISPLLDSYLPGTISPQLSGAAAVSSQLPDMAAISSPLPGTAAVSPQLHGTTAASPQLYGTVAVAVSPQFSNRAAVSPQLPCAAAVSPQSHGTSAVSPQSSVMAAVSPQLPGSSAVSSGAGFSQLPPDNSLPPNSVVITPFSISPRGPCSRPQPSITPDSLGEFPDDSLSDSTTAASPEPSSGHNNNNAMKIDPEATKINSKLESQLQLHQSPEGTYRCLQEDCQYENRQLDYMLSHLWRRHEHGRPSHACQLCDLAYFSTRYEQGVLWSISISMG